MKNLILLIILFSLSSLAIGQTADSTKVKKVEKPKVVSVTKHVAVTGMAGKWHQEVLDARKKNKAKTK